MDETNVNNLNGVPNFGHGLPDDGIVEAGITDVVGDATTVEAPTEVEEAPIESDTTTIEAPALEAETVTVENAGVATE